MQDIHNELSEYNPLRNSFENALNLCFQGEYTQAVSRLQAMAPSYPRAILFLDWIQQQHPGAVKISLKNKELIERSLIASAHQNGDLDSAYDYGVYCFLSQRDSEALAWFKQGDRQGNPNAQFSLGLCYVKANDLEKAARCFYDAAQQGHVQALSYLSLCCLDDEHLAQNYLVCFKELQKSKDKELRAQAIFHLGFCYFAGIGGMKQDYREAAKLFKKIWAENKEALYYFAMCCYNEPSLVTDYDSVCKLYNFSSEKHGNKAHFLAEKFVRMAAERGHRESQSTLGIFLLEGIGGRTDFKEAYAWFKKAVDQGHQGAKYCLEQLNIAYKGKPVLNDTLEEKRVRVGLKVNDIFFNFDQQARALPKELRAQSQHVKRHLVKMFAFMGTVGSSLSTVNAPVKEAKSEPEALPASSSNTLSSKEIFERKPELVNIATIETLAQKPEIEKSMTESSLSVSVSTSEQIPPDSPPSVASGSKRQSKKKKEKNSPKQQAHSEPVLSLAEAQDLLNKAIVKKVFDTKEKEQLSQWFEIENAIKDNKDANSYYCLGLYCEYVAKKYLEAFELYKKAVDKDPRHGRANYHLGLCYGEDYKNFQNGKPMQKDRQKALEYYQVAAQNGHKLAGLACERVHKKIEDAKKIREQRKDLINKTSAPSSPIQEPKSEVVEVSNPSETPDTPIILPAEELSSSSVEVVSLNPLEAEIDSSLSATSNPVEAEAKSEVSNTTLSETSSDSTLETAEKESKQPSGKSSEWRRGKVLCKEGCDFYYLAQYDKAIACFEEASKCGYLLGYLYAGLLLEYVQKDNPRAKECFERLRKKEEWFLEENQNPKRLFYAGLYCELVLKKEAKAIAYYTQAAEKGEIEAQTHLGKYYFYKKDGKQAEHWLQKAAEENADAAYYLGISQLGGRGIKKEEAKGIQSLQKAADKWHVIALYTLGDCYHRGVGIAADSLRAYLNFKTSANKGWSGAYCRLAEFHWRGWFVTRDLDEAERLLKLADIDEAEELLVKLREEREQEKAEIKAKPKAKSKAKPLEAKENVQTASSLSSSHSSSIKTPLAFSKEFEEEFEKGVQAYDLRDYKKAFTYFTEAAAAGYPPAYTYLGMLIENGEYVEKDPRKAKEYYAKARGKEEVIWLSQPGRELYLGLYWQFAANPKNIDEAAKNYEIAANKKRQMGQMQYRAQFRLAHYYHLKGNVKSALKWFTSAGNNKYPPAQEQLGVNAITRYEIYSENFKTFEPKHPDYIEAIGRLQEAAAKGHIGAQFYLGKFLYDAEIAKKGIPRNFNEAMKHLTKASAHEDVEAQHILGLCHYEKQEYKEAERLLTIVVEKNNFLALGDLQKCREKLKAQGEESIPIKALTGNSVLNAAGRLRLPSLPAEENRKVSSVSSNNYGAKL